MEHKKTPTALDYLVVHHVCRAYLKSVAHIASGRRDDLVSELYEESIQFLTGFVEAYTFSAKGLNQDTRKVLSLMEVSISKRDKLLDDMSKPLLHLH